MAAAPPPVPETLQHTHGALQQIFRDPSITPQTLNPVLEVRHLRPVGPGGCLVSVTDGVEVIKAYAPQDSGLHKELEAGRIVIHSLIRVKEWQLVQYQAAEIFAILQIDALGVLPPHRVIAAERLRKFVNPRTGITADSGMTQAEPDARAATFTTPEKQVTGVGVADITPHALQRGGAPSAARAEAPPAAPAGALPSVGFPQYPAAAAPAQAPTLMKQEHSVPAGPTQMTQAHPEWPDSRGFAMPISSGASFGLPAATTQGGIMPIKELSPYTNGRWRIKARVVAKQEIRRISKPQREIQLFKIDIADQSGEISATFFGKAVDKFYPHLQQGQVYIFSRGRVGQGNPRFDRSEFVLTFEESASIEAVADDGGIPGVVYDFRLLSEVELLDINTLVDVKAVIYAVQEPMTFMSRNSNREITKRELTLWDNSGPNGVTYLDLTVWGEKTAVNFEMGSVIFLRGARITEWQNQKNLSGWASMELNPDDPRAFALLAKFEEFQRQAAPALPVNRTLQAAPGMRKTIDACREEDMNLAVNPGFQAALDPTGPKIVHRHVVIGTVTSVPSDRMPCYPACPESVEAFRGPAPAGGNADRRLCNKKATQESPGVWRCNAGHTSQTPIWRYLCRVQVMDHTDSFEVQLYDHVAKKLFGCDASECAQIWEDPEQVQQFHNRVLWRRVVLRLRAQKEFWQEAERLKYSVDEAGSVNVAKEAKQMLEEVQASLASLQMQSPQ